MDLARERGICRRFAVLLEKTLRFSPQQGGVKENFTLDQVSTLSTRAQTVVRLRGGAGERVQLWGWC